MKSNFKNTRQSLILIFIGVLLFSSCGPEKDIDALRFKTGVFEIPAGKGYSKTIVTRIDSLQIEEYVKFAEISTDSGAVSYTHLTLPTIYSV